MKIRKRRDLKPEDCWTPHSTGLVSDFTIKRHSHSGRYRIGYTPIECF